LQLKDGRCVIVQALAESVVAQLGVGRDTVGCTDVKIRVRTDPCQWLEPLVSAIGRSTNYSRQYEDPPAGRVVAAPPVGRDLRVDVGVAFVLCLVEEESAFPRARGETR